MKIRLIRVRTFTYEYELVFKVRGAHTSSKVLGEGR